MGESSARKRKIPLPDDVKHGASYVSYIKSKQDEVLSEEKAHQAIEKIKSGRLVAFFKAHRKHVEHVKQIVLEKFG